MADRDAFYELIGKRLAWEEKLRLPLARLLWLEALLGLTPWPLLRLLPEPLLEPLATWPLRAGAALFDAGLLDPESLRFGDAPATAVRFYGPRTYPPGLSATLCRFGNSARLTLGWPAGTATPEEAAEFGDLFEEELYGGA